MSDKNGPSGGSSPSQNKAAQPVAQIIEAFGGLRPMAGKLKVAVSTVQGWKERDSIPTARHGEILSAAKAHDIALDPAVLSASDHMTRNQTAKPASPSGTAAVSGAKGPKDQDVKKDDKDSKPAAAPAATSPAASGSSPKETAAKSNGGGAKSAIPAAGGSKASDSGTPEPKASDSKASTAPATGSKSAQAKASESKTAAPKTPAPKVPDDSPPPPTRKSGGGLSGFVMGVVVLAVVLAGAVYTRGHWLPLVESLPMMAGGEAATPGGVSEEAAARIAALESKLADLESQVASASGAVDLTAVDQAIAEANQRIDALDGTLEQLLAGGVVIAADGQEGQTDSDAPASAGSVLDREELTALKAQVEELAGQIDAGAGSGADAGSQAGTQPAETRLAELTARLDEIERTVTGLEDPAERLSELDSRLSAAEQGVAAVPALESRLSAELTALGEALPTGPSEDAGDAAMFLALLQLREALSGSGAFETELMLVDGLAAEDAELKSALAPLSAHAATGIPGLPGLRVSFDGMAGRVVAAARGGETDDWIAKTVRKVSEAVTIRPVGLVEGDDAGAVLARAEVKLDAGDLAGAVAELDGLTGSAAEGAAAWRQDAESRMEAQKALSLLAARAATLIGLGG